MPVAFQRGVMANDDLIVGGKLHVAFDGICLLRNSQIEGGSRAFRTAIRNSTVSHDPAFFLLREQWQHMLEFT